MSCPHMLNKNSCFRCLQNYCEKCKATYGDGHDCDNCPFCGTDGVKDEPTDRSNT